MKNELGIELTEKELIKNAMNDLANACCFLFETNSDTGHALAFMVDNALKYAQVVYRGHDVLSASADYTSYENKVYLKEKKNIEVIK